MEWTEYDIAVLKEEHYFPSSFEDLYHYRFPYELLDKTKLSEYKIIEHSIIKSFKLSDCICVVFDKNKKIKHIIDLREKD